MLKNIMTGCLMAFAWSFVYMGMRVMERENGGGMHEHEGVHGCAWDEEKWVYMEGEWNDGWWKWWNVRAYSVYRKIDSGARMWGWEYAWKRIWDEYSMREDMGYTELTTSVAAKGALCIASLLMMMENPFTLLWTVFPLHTQISIPLTCRLDHEYFK